MLASQHLHDGACLDVALLVAQSTFPPRAGGQIPPHHIHRHSVRPVHLVHDEQGAVLDADDDAYLGLLRRLCAHLHQVELAVALQRLRVCHALCREDEVPEEHLHLVHARIQADNGSVLRALVAGVREVHCASRASVQPAHHLHVVAHCEYLDGVGQALLQMFVDARLLCEAGVQVQHERLRGFVHRHHAARDALQRTSHNSHSIPRQQRCAGSLGPLEGSGQALRQRALPLLRVTRRTAQEPRAAAGWLEHVQLSQGGLGVLRVHVRCLHLLQHEAVGVEGVLEAVPLHVQTAVACRLHRGATAAGPGCFQRSLHLLCREQALGGAAARPARHGALVGRRRQQAQVQAGHGHEEHPRAAIQDVSYLGQVALVGAAFEAHPGSTGQILVALGDGDDAGHFPDRDELDAAGAPAVHVGNALDGLLHVSLVLRLHVHVLLGGAHDGVNAQRLPRGGLGEELVRQGDHDFHLLPGLRRERAGEGGGHRHSASSTSATAHLHSDHPQLRVVHTWQLSLLGHKAPRRALLHNCSLSVPRFPAKQLSVKQCRAVGGNWTPALLTLTSSRSPQQSHVHSSSPAHPSFDLRTPHESASQACVLVQPQVAWQPKGAWLTLSAATLAASASCWSVRERHWEESSSSSSMASWSR